MNLIPTKLCQMRIKGLASDPIQFKEQTAHTSQLLQLLNWKQQHNKLPLIVALMGGTGTGKSTLFNALIQRKISAESVRRPTTGGGIAYIHQDFISTFRDRDFPFLTHVHGNNESPILGKKGHLTLVSHHQTDQSHIFIDSPDVDSICVENKNHAHHLSLLADIILFVTSCEKYADQEPLEIIDHAQKIGKKLLIVLNKHDDFQLAQSIQHHFYKIVGKNLPFFSISRRTPTNASDFQGDVISICQYLDTSISKHKLKKQEILALSNYYNTWLTTIQKKFDHELEVLKKIENILGDASQIAKDLLVQSPAAFDRAYFDKCIKPHIKAVYNRHDLFAPVRQWLIETLKKPFYLITPEKSKLSKEIRPPEMDITPILSALSEYQMYVKRHVSSEIFIQNIHEKTPELDEKTVTSLFNEKMTTINRWLSGQFEHLNQGIPIQKRIGMHALSLIWGSAILGIETISGGGLTPIELALDSLIAPYITAGTTELFVVNELKNIVYHLRNQYIKALYAIIDNQHHQYLDILKQLQPESAAKNGLVFL
jgi:energy-coupling factor transporter ATP-binding protein EcfA2